jgi:aldehyde dehydrogenase (NAD+)
MNQSEVQNIIKEQRSFFNSGATREIPYRLQALKKLRKLIQEHEEELYQAFRMDLGKHPFESYASENGLVLQELNLAIRNLKRWSRPKHAYTPAAHWPARSYYRPEPFGNVLIISPWNYPFQLLFMPLVGAVSAGNCVLAKPSQYATHTFRVMQKILNANFDPGHIRIIEGGREINQFLLEECFDYIFFTGSTEIGKLVMKSAARNLTPVSLELGGKSPVIVEPDVNVSLAAKRIMWGKLLNAGQSCVAPDYVLVHESIKEDLISGMAAYLKAKYGNDLKSNPDYARIIDARNIDRLQSYLSNVKIRVGGETDPEQKFIAPTIVEVDDAGHPIMYEEIFGPILPVIPYHELDEAISTINLKPKPLSLYIFARSGKVQKEILRKTMSGTAGINETVVHFVNPYLPFGGVGKSGMGRYHGKYSFQTFSYKRSILDKASWLDIPVRYPPYRSKMRIIKLLIR